MRTTVGDWPEVAGVPEPATARVPAPVARDWVPQERPYEVTALAGSGVMSACRLYAPRTARTAGAICSEMACWICARRGLSAGRVVRSWSRTARAAARLANAVPGF